MLKDHLGNVRMLLTDEVLTTPYPAATMEPATIGDESKIYSNLTSTQTDKPSWFNDPLYSTSTKVARLKNAAGSAKVGPSIILKVMAGDTYNIRVTSGWSSPNSPYNYNSGVLTDLLNQLINGLPSVSGGKATASDLQNSGTGLNGSLSSYINQLPYSTTTPKAYLNWVLLDEQFKIAKNEYGTIIASGYSGFDAVDANGVMKTHVLSNLPVAKSGYLVIYTSNEASNIDVYFDNLQVTHTRGPILEETHYYPFGLTMAGMSSITLNFGSAENKKKYNGIEFENDLGLNVYDAQFRELDTQTDRWWQIDPITNGYESISPYASMYNNPITISDPLGDEGEDCCKEIWNAIVDGVTWVNNNLNPVTPVAEFITGKSLNSNFTEYKSRGESAFHAATFLAPTAKVETIVANEVKNIVAGQVEKQVLRKIDQEALKRGVKNEAKVLADEGLKKNTSTITVLDPKTGKNVRTIPDAKLSNGATVEVKDVKKLTDSKQLRAQSVFSAQNKQKATVITGQNTKVSQTVQQRMNLKRRPDIGPQN
jgi:RHS repeat-associated protein